MAYILIDGYNLIGIAHKNIEKARTDIIEKLCNYSNLKEQHITIVFDGWKGGQGAETRMRMGDVNIIYTRLGEKADFVIKKILSDGMKPWIVISSDREISDFAEKKGFASISSDEFEEKLDAAFYHDKEAHVSCEMDGAACSRRHKGNPRKLSQKQKRKMSALKKI